MATTGKRALSSDSDWVHVPGQPPSDVNWDTFKAKRTEVFECKRDPRFPDFLRVLKDEMGEDSFNEWLGFGIETPEADVARFKAWAEATATPTGSERDVHSDIHVDLASLVVPMAGIDNVRALLTVPKVACTPTKLAGNVDLFVLLDQSGSMECNNTLLRDAMINMADEAKDFYDAEQSGKHEAKSKHSVNINFAYARFGNDCADPGLGGGVPQPSGYVPWMPLHEMKAPMRNVASSLSATMGGTNLSRALDRAFADLSARREEEELPPTYMQHLLLMTDGMPNQGAVNAVALRQLISAARGTDPVVVHVLCLGDQVDMDLCTALAKTTNGVVAHASDGASLSDAFQSITVAMRASAKPFCVEMKDKGGRHRVELFGILTNENNTALTDFDFGAKSEPGNHLGATVGLLKHPPTAVVPLYAEPDDPAWIGPLNRAPKALTDALDTERIVEEHRVKVERAARDQGFEAALQLSSGLTAEYESMGLGPVPLQRIRAFHAELDRTISVQSAATASHGGGMPSALGRSMTVSAVCSRASYSQSY